MKVINFWKSNIKNTNKVSFKPSAKKPLFSPVKLTKYPARTKSEWRLIDKNPFGDKDKDRVLNIFDCKPLNKRKQGIYHLPMTKKGHLREYRKSIPIVVKSDRGELIDVLSRKGVTTYRKTNEEKLADIQRDYPENESTVKSQIELEKGNASGILAKGRTPGKVIFKQTAYKSVPEYKDKYGQRHSEKKIKQLAIVDTETGDIEHFQETGKYTKKEIEKDRAEEEKPEYHPLSEEYRIKDSDRTTEVLNKNPIDVIREKREALRNEARMSKLNDEYPEEGTIKAFQKAIATEGEQE